MSDEMSMFDKMREQLLGPTLEFCAANVPHYTETWGAAWREVTAVSDLGKLPLLDKKTAIGVQDKLRSGVPFIPNPVLSSGTQRDGTQVLEVLVGEDELEAAARFHAMMADAALDAEGGAGDPAITDEELPPPRRELVVVNAHHGLPFERTTERRILVPFMPHANSLVQIQRLLERTFDDDTRVEALLMSVTNLKTLTLWLLSEGVDPSSFGVRDIGTNSSPLSSPWRERLEEVWDARLWDNYSLSEFRTHACECELCGWYHFDHLPIVHELIDPLSGEVTDRGVGELVLTSLYPYAQAMPLVRYRTGDLLERDRSCETGEVGFAYLGRVSECLLAPSDEGSDLLFAPGPLLEITDELASVALRPQQHEQLGLIPPGSVGRPWTWVDFDGERVVIFARLRFHPAVFPEHTERLETELRRAVTEVFPALAARPEAGLEVVLLPPVRSALTAPLDPELIG
jgi:phenylacetate-coenzyme A ligase PaaK-like adenylate-forming protein